MSNQSELQADSLNRRAFLQQASAAIGPMTATSNTETPAGI